MSTCPACQAACDRVVPGETAPYWRCAAGHAFRLYLTDRPSEWAGRVYRTNRAARPGCPDGDCKAPMVANGPLWSCPAGHTYWPVDRHLADRFEGKPPAHLSFSAAEKFHQCALAWKHRYIDRWPDPSGLAAVLGSFTHKVLELGAPAEAERVLDGWRQLAATTFASLQDEADFVDVMTAAGAYDPLEGRVDLHSPAVRAFKTDAWGRLAKAIALLPTLDPAFQVETRLELEIGGVPFIGYVDRIGKAAGKDRRIFGAASVVDWKSGSHRKKRPGEVDSKPYQGALYGVGVAEQLGVAVERAELIYLNHPTPEVVRVDVAATKDAALAWLNAAWDGIATGQRSGAWPANPGYLCPWCPAVDRCPEGQDFTAWMVNRPDGWPAFARSSYAARLANTPPRRQTGQLADGGLRGPLVTNPYSDRPRFSDSLAPEAVGWTLRRALEPGRLLDTTPCHLEWWRGGDREPLVSWTPRDPSPDTLEWAATMAAVGLKVFDANAVVLYMDTFMRIYDLDGDRSDEENVAAVRDHIANHGT